MSQSPTGDFLLGRKDFCEKPKADCCLNPPRGIFCWEVIAESLLVISVLSLNPPRGIFCWEARALCCSSSRTPSQSPTGDFLLGSRAPLTAHTGGAKCSLNPPRGIFCWEAHRQRIESSSRQRRVSIPHGGFFVGKLAGPRT